MALLAALAACDDGRPELPTAAPGPLSGDVRFLGAEDPVPGRYIVAFREDRVGSAAAAAQELVPALGGKVHFTYEHALKGFAADLSPAAVQALLADPRVAYVAQDGMVMPADTQTSAPWGLDRIDQRDQPLNALYTYDRTGAGVTAYVIDTGILTAHTEFGGRASVGGDFVGDGEDGQDCNGHGTHVAGTIGGATYGVAKEVELVALRVFPCSGGAAYSIVIAAVDWVTANAQQPAVVNMSLGGYYYEPMNQALQASIAAGNTYVVAAGNDNWDACGYSPASTPEAITVAATTSYDSRSWFSNWGSCVDVFAPGSDITSAWWSSTTATNTISGTSMASPHVAGVAALYLEANPSATPAAVATAIQHSASLDRVTDVAGSPNRLVYSPLTVPRFLANPRVLEFAVLRMDAGGSSAAGTVARQAFTASGAGAAKTERAGGGGVGAASQHLSTRTLVLTNSGATPLAWTALDSVAWMSVSPAGGTLAAGASVTLNVTVNADSLAAGTHNTTLVLAGDGHTESVPVTVAVTTGAMLANGVAVDSLWGDYSTPERFFGIAVPAGADSLVVTISGGSGDADLYVRRGALPTYALWDCRPYYGGNYERCTAALPAADNYYIMLHTFSPYSDVTLLATIYGLPARPDAPTGVTATGAGAGKVNVAWADNSDDETVFRVRRATRNGDGTFGPYATVGQRGPNNRSLLDSTVVVGATYRYQVQACNALGCTSSAPSSAITIVLPPAAPTGLAGVVVAGGEVDLTWTDASSNETSFRVRRALRNPDGTFPAYTTIRTLPGGTTAYADTSAALGSTYRYQVQACNGGGCATSGAVVATVPTIPAAPPAIGGAAVSSSRVDLQWTDGSTNETQFRVRRTIRNPDGTYPPYVTIATRSANVTTYPDTTVTPGAIHRYIVQACNISGCSNSPNVAITVPGS
ncbi:MAG TPA: S8 family serine peptidase [Longimicrobium sp.]|nr:S8 family serine peptidase [Longimicrobium sp.]